MILNADADLSVGVFMNQAFKNYLKMLPSICSGPAVSAYADI